MSLGDLGRIIDGLYLKTRSGVLPRRRLLVLVGNGISPVANILNQRQLLESARRNKIDTSRGSVEFQEYKWRVFEVARYYTANALPNLGHAAIYRLVADGICRDVITTNYDLFFDAIWAKHPDLHILQNPVLSRKECAWDGLYSYEQPGRDLPRYWKIHGSLSHIVFRGSRDPECCQIHRLPRFAVSTNQDDLSTHFRNQTLAPFLGFEAQAYPLTRIPHPKQLKRTFTPFIDWTFNNKRDLFRREIEAAKRILSDVRSIAAILIVGWRGYYNSAKTDDPRNEELAPDLLRLVGGRHLPPIFMAVHQRQFRLASLRTSALMRRIIAQGNCFEYSNVDHFVTELLFKACRNFPFPSLTKQHEIWANHWFLDTKEPTYA
jgi:hypothetical protein